MKKLIYSFLFTIISLSVFGQTYSPVGNALQRAPTAGGYFYRLNLGAPGFMYLYSQSQVDSLLSLKANASSAVPNTRSILNGYGILGGTSLATDITKSIDTANIVSKPFFNTVIGTAALTRINANTASIALKANLSGANFTGAINATDIAGSSSVSGPLGVFNTIKIINGTIGNTTSGSVQLAWQDRVTLGVPSYKWKTMIGGNPVIGPSTFDILYNSTLALSITEAGVVNDGNGNRFLTTVDGGSKLDTTGSALSVKRDFAAKGNAIVLTDATVTASSTTITSPSAHFTSSDIGKTVGIPYAGTDTLGLHIGKTFLCKITAVGSATSVTVNNAPVKSISGPRTITDAVMILGSTTLTSATANWQYSDIGKILSIPGVGDATSYGSPADSISVCYIVAYISSTQVTVSKFALAAVTGRTVAIPGAWLEYGADDTQALNSATAYASSKKKKLVIENGRYLITAKIKVASNLNVVGYGYGNSIISPVGYSLTVFDGNHSGVKDSTLVNVSFSNLEIDGNGVTTNNYTSENKAFFIRPVTNLNIDHVYVHDVSATGIGCDYVVNGTILYNKGIRNGKQLAQFGNTSGGAFIGIGTGKRSIEPTLIIGNYGDNNGSYSVFSEGQTDTLKTKGTRIIGNYAAWDLVGGIGDLNNDGTIIEANQVYYQKIGIHIGLTPFLTTRNQAYSKNTVITNNKIIDNISGINITSKLMGIAVLNNTVSAGSNIASTGGIVPLSVDSGAYIQELRIEGNTVTGIKGPGIDYERPIFGTTFGNIIERNNVLFNNGASTGTQSAGTRLAAPALAYTNDGNVAFDTRAGGSKTQNYALTATFLAQIGQFNYDGSSYSYGNSAGRDNIGTMPAPTTTQLKPNYFNAGTWTTTQTFATIAPTTINSTTINNSGTVTAGTVSTPSITGPASMTVSPSVGTLTLRTTGASSLFLGTNATNYWSLSNTNGDLRPVTDNVTNFGDATHRIATGYFTNLQLGITAGSLLKSGGAGANISAAVAGTDYLPVASPAMSGTPTAPTAIQSVNTTQLATTGFAHAAVATTPDNIVGITGDFTIAAGSFTALKNTTLDLYVDATVGNVTITMPSASTFAGYTIFITRTDASANTVTINTVLGGSTLTTQYQSRTFKSNATSWFNH